MKSNKTLLIDGGMVVEESPTTSGRLLVAAGCEISDADMKRYDLTPADLGIGQAAAEPNFPVDNAKPASDFKALSEQPVALEVKPAEATKAEEKPKTGVIIEKPVVVEKTIGSKKRK